MWVERQQETVPPLLQHLSPFDPDSDGVGAGQRRRRRRLLVLCPRFARAARAMAARVLSHRESKDDRLKYAFQIATSRSPTESELQVLARRIDALQSDFADHPQEAIDFLSVGD